jgi:glycosyltransferase involved in cell wall biosynthesis
MESPSGTQRIDLLAMKPHKILYLGNILSGHGFTPTTVEILGPKLALDHALILASNKQNKLLRLLDMVWALVKNRKSLKFVLIDTYTFVSFYYALITAIFCKVFKIRYIPFLHGGGLPGRFDRNPKLSKWYLSNAHAILSPSGFLKEAAESRFPVTVEVIPNFIDISQYKFQPRTTLAPLRILWVRSFDKTYHPELSIQIAAALVKQLGDVTLTMVGPDKDGSLARCQTLAAQLGIGDRVTFTGKLAKSEWITLSTTHNLFLSTTRADNMPVSVMEAMALGMPVVTSKVGGIPYLFIDREEGIMVDEQSISAFTLEILKLYNAPQLTGNISANARKKAESWDWQVVRKQWMNLFY